MLVMVRASRVLTHSAGSLLILLLCASRRNQALVDVCNLLVDEELADPVWEAWDKREIDDQVACIAWMLIVERPLCPRKRTLS